MCKWGQRGGRRDPEPRAAGLDISISPICPEISAISLPRARLSTEGHVSVRALHQRFLYRAPSAPHGVTGEATVASTWRGMPGHRDTRSRGIRLNRDGKLG